LSNVDLTTLAGDAVNIQCFHTEIILDRLKEIDNPPRQEACCFDVMSLQHLLMQFKIGPTIGKKNTNVGSSLGKSSLKG
jgi:hypothetical protein